MLDRHEVLFDLLPDGGKLHHTLLDIPLDVEFVGDFVVHPAVPKDVLLFGE